MEEVTSDVQILISEEEKKEVRSGMEETGSPWGLYLLMEQSSLFLALLEKHRAEDAKCASR